MYLLLSSGNLLAKNKILSINNNEDVEYESDNENISKSNIEEKNRSISESSDVFLCLMLQETEE